MTNLNKNIKLNKELLLNLFSRFIQNQGKSEKAKKLMINISANIDSKVLSNSNFVYILEYIICKLFLPMVMVKTQSHETKYYFLVTSLLKYIKKFVFSPFVKNVRGHKKFPFIYNFLGEIQKILKAQSTLIDYKEDVIDVFMDTSSNIQARKYENNNKIDNTNIGFTYSCSKLKYLKRYNYFTNRFYSIKLNNIYNVIHKKYINKKN